MIDNDAISLAQYPISAVVCKLAILLNQVQAPSHASNFSRAE